MPRCARHEGDCSSILWPSSLFPVVARSSTSCNSVRLCSRDKLSAECRSGGSDKCGGISMDSLITAAARALAAGDPLGALKRVALRDDRACPRAARYRDGAARRSRPSQGSPAKCRACLQCERGRGPREVRGRRGRDRARLARPGLAGEVARGGARDARSARRPRQRGARTVPRDSAPPPHRAPRRGRTCAGRSRPRDPPARATDDSRLVAAGIALRRLQTKRRAMRSLGPGSLHAMRESLRSWRRSKAHRRC